MHPGRKFVLVFLPCLLAVLALLIYPIYVIRPFRAQGPRELMLALAVMRYRPAGLLVLVSAALAAVVWYWRSERRTLRRFASAAGMLMVGAAALLARVNVYELMFHPIDRMTFSPVSSSKLGPGEKVIAIRIGDEARAYPVRGMSYHHIVNDRLGGVPIAATY
jgi:hypothetical protein